MHLVNKIFKKKIYKIYYENGLTQSGKHPLSCSIYFS